MANGRCGYKKITDPTTQFISGPCRIYGFNLVSAGGAAIDLFDGTDSTGTDVISELSNTSHALYLYPEGRDFRAGCFIVCPGIAYVTLFYEKI